MKGPSPFEFGEIEEIEISCNPPSLLSNHTHFATNHTSCHQTTPLFSAIFCVHHKYLACRIWLAVTKSDAAGLTLMVYMSVTLLMWKSDGDTTASGKTTSVKFAGKCQLLARISVAEGWQFELMSLSLAYSRIFKIDYTHLCHWRETIEWSILLVRSLWKWRPVSHWRLLSQWTLY